MKKVLVLLFVVYFTTIQAIGATECNCSRGGHTTSGVYFTTSVQYFTLNGDCCFPSAGAGVYTRSYHGGALMRERILETAQLAAFYAFACGGCPRYAKIKKF